MKIIAGTVPYFSTSCGTTGNLAKLRRTVDTSYKEAHSSPMSILQTVREKMTRFRVDPIVGATAYHKPGGKVLGDRVVQIDAQACERAACNLEAALVMTDKIIDPDELIMVQFTRQELSSFVGYMRELDRRYRELTMGVKHRRR